MACFAVINVSQGSVEHTQDAMDVQYPFNCKFTKKSSSEKNCKSVKIWQNYGHESVAPFLGPPCMRFWELYPQDGAENQLA